MLMPCAGDGCEERIDTEAEGYTEEQVKRLVRGGHEFHCSRCEPPDLEADVSQGALFDLDELEWWKPYWGEDMPEYVAEDAKPHDSMTVHFRNSRDRREFLRLLGHRTDRRAMSCVPWSRIRTPRKRDPLHPRQSYITW